MQHMLIRNIFQISIETLARDFMFCYTKLLFKVGYTILFEKKQYCKIFNSEIILRFKTQIILDKMI